MNRSLLPVHRGRTAAVSTVVAAVLALSLAGCGDEDSEADQASTSDVHTAADATTTDPAFPETETRTGDSEPVTHGSAASLAGLGERDELERVEFPGPDTVFDDGSSASSDGTTLTVTTPAEETFSIALPTESEGWIYDIRIDLGDAGIGYMVTQTGGEYIDTFLVVLDDGELYYPEPDADVVFGQFAGEGSFFETYTTDGGSHLVTRLEDAPSGAADEYYEWGVEDRTMVPTTLTP